MTLGSHFVDSSIDSLAAFPFSTDRTARISLDAPSLAMCWAASKPGNGEGQSGFESPCNEAATSVFVGASCTFVWNIPSPTFDPVTITVLPAKEDGSCGSLPNNWLYTKFLRVNPSEASPGMIAAGSGDSFDSTTKQNIDLAPITTAVEGLYMMMLSCNFSCSSTISENPVDSEITDEREAGALRPRCASSPSIADKI